MYIVWLSVAEQHIIQNFAIVLHLYAISLTEMYIYIYNMRNSLYTECETLYIQ